MCLFMLTLAAQFVNMSYRNVRPRVSEGMFVADDQCKEVDVFVSIYQILETSF